MTPREKAELLAALPLPDPYLFAGVPIRIVASTVRDGNLVVVVAGARSNPYVFVNPPCETVAGAGDADAALREIVGASVVRARR